MKRALDEAGFYAFGVLSVIVVALAIPVVAVIEWRAGRRRRRLGMGR